MEIAVAITDPVACLDIKDCGAMIKKQVNLFFSLFLMMSWMHTYGSSTASVPFTHSPDLSVMTWYWHFLKC